MQRCLVILALCTLCRASFINVYPKVKTLPVNGAPGEPLYLTEYIEVGKIQEGQKAARVNMLNIESYSGYLTVDKQNNSNLFFWYFPAETNPDTAPVAVWLQGGPGASSMFAIFTESGPFVVSSYGELKKRQYYWSQFMHVIYIDNPVGTGFSFTDNEDAYSTNELEVGENLYTAIVQFFQLFPNLQQHDFFITGESYGGKYVPAMGFAIHENNPDAALKVNLKGIAIGDGLVDPEYMMDYGSYLYQIGLIDWKARSIFQQYEAKTKQLIQAGKFEEAFKYFDAALNGDLTPYKSFFFNQTRYTNYYNYLQPDADDDIGFSWFLQQASTRSKIHVGSVPFSDGTLVEKKMTGDIMQSVKPWLQILMDSYRVMLYNGQLDIICSYPLTMNYVYTLKWKDSRAYALAERIPWYVNNQLAGYAKQAGKFTEVLVRNAGHMVPHDQPYIGLDLIMRFVYNLPFQQF